MAGALAICGDDFEAPARQIARENGIPHIEEDGLTVQIGYYDAGGIYGDFSEYKNFEADPDPDTRFFSRSHDRAWEREKKQITALFYFLFYLL